MKEANIKRPLALIVHQSGSYFGVNTLVWRVVEGLNVLGLWCLGSWRWRGASEAAILVCFCLLCGFVGGFCSLFGSLECELALWKLLSWGRRRWRGWLLWRGLLDSIWRCSLSLSFDRYLLCSLIFFVDVLYFVWPVIISLQIGYFRTF